MSNAPRIYVRGSYIDIHDNENVYLTVDKDGEVKTRTLSPGDIPDELRTPQACTLHEELCKDGLLDEGWQPVGLSNSEKGMLASWLSGKLGIVNQWKWFAALWGMKPENLRSAYYKALEQTKSLTFQDRLKNIQS